MKNKFICNFFFLLLITFSSSFSQWSGGISANVKNDEPEAGVGFIIGRNLPFQWPTVGLKLRFEADFYTQRVPRTELTEKDFHLSLIATLFPSDFQPYFGIGPGYSLLKANETNTSSFILSALAGIQFAFFNPVYPFIEINSYNFLSELNKIHDRFEKYQWGGSVGIRMEF